MGGHGAPVAGWWVSVGLAVAARGGCVGREDGAIRDHEESADFEPFDASKADGVASTFNRNSVVDDSFFTAATAVDAIAVQDSRLLKLAREDFIDLLADNVEITQGVLKGIVMRLKGVAGRVSFERTR